MAIFKLISEDLSHLGGPMGSEYTTENFVRYFSSVAKAKKAAEKDYGTKHEPIKWKKYDGKYDGEWRSGDLGFVMYTISKIEVE